MADDTKNENPGGEGKTETVGKPTTASAPASAPTSAAPDTTPIPQSIKETTDSPADSGTLATDARTVPDKDGNDRRVIGDPNAPLTQVGDPEGKVTNRFGGTVQAEAKPEDLPADAKIAPVAEQVNPNAASQAVGAAPTPEQIAGVEQPKEGEKNVVPDASDSTQFLSPESDQHDEAERADEDAQRYSDRTQGS